MNGGFVDDINQLNRMPQEEFDNILTIVQSAENDVIAIADDDYQFEEMAEIPNLSIEDRIQRLKPKPNQRINVTELLKEGSLSFETFLLWYSAEAKFKNFKPFK
ncbi:hypothetical protein TRFO_12135 [Tritrichomonas foetus]|uniref:Uncharacterized protein n=1 Tax=Tritrichomonas foetus TaxID=1144522 RepID=A0A1J4J028_9EUKA|nr:hypothetical protein TRFO_12135 [Tritrichomonas foetus]|eukprot:OHS92952.1 hypothetical protein TRFO_12135 [Tritrichomonas foetus]